MLSILIIYFVFLEDYVGPKLGAVRQFYASLWHRVCVFAWWIKSRCDLQRVYVLVCSWCQRNSDRVLVRWCDILRLFF